VSLARRRWLSGLGAASLGVPFVFRDAAAAGSTKLVYQTGWLPEADEAGMYQAVATGLYRSHGLDVELHAGGPDLNSIQLFLAGKAHFVTTDAYRVADIVQRGLPGVAIAAFYQRSPHAILSHPHVGNDTLAQLKGKPILISEIDRESFWMWLKAKYGYTEDQARPYTFNMAPFVVDKNLSMQGYVTNEPYQARRAGVDPVVNLLADNGFFEYHNVILAAPRMVTQQPDVIARFVDATVKGWQSYLHGDPRPANTAIKRGNTEMTDDLIAFARSAMKRYALFDSADVAKHGLGAMSDAAWTNIYRSGVAAGALPAGLDLRKGYSLAFVTGRGARA
jgi:NitT/TauT family transport system substrate-binding protein